MPVMLLGPVVVESANDHFSPRSNVGRALLALLALADGQPVSPQRLYQGVWGDRPSPSPTANVQVAVCRLRRWLADIGANWVKLETVSGLYRLDCAPQTDLRRFRDLVARSTGQEATEGFRTLENALELWRGPALADAAGAGLASAAIGLERELTQATVRCARAAVRIGEPERAMAIAAARSPADPFDEDLHAALIDALTDAGQQIAALRTFEDVRRRLATELGADPGTALKKAHLRALRQPQPDGGELHWLPCPMQLPADLPAFTGRAQQLNLLRQWLTQPAAVVVIAGIPGVGKTALAVHIAYCMKQQFRDGQLYVDLRGVGGRPRSPGDVLGRMLRALGRRGRTIPRDTDERAAAFRAVTANRRILVLLDNAADESQVRQLLPGGRGCVTLITSRRRLAALPDAELLELPTMSATESVSLLHHIVGHGRADAEPAATRDIAAQCGNLPLALRVAGCKLAERPHQRISWLAARLQDEQQRLDELATGDLAVRASIALSYHAASTKLRQTFRLLSLAEAATFGPQLLMAILDVEFEWAEDCLDALARIHLLQTAARNDTGQVLYRFHDLIRLYARERAVAEESPEAIQEAVARAQSAVESRPPVIAKSRDS